MNTVTALRPLFYIALLAVIITGCGPKKEKPKDVKPTFKAVWGIHYTEVKRRLANGLSFDSFGYQQEPSWRLTFPVDDSAHIYSPDRKKFYYFPVTFDHDSIVNMARTWLRVKKVTKDSLVFQVLKVEGTTIYLTAAKLYMTFYADDYIKNKLHTTAENLMRPSRADTAFIRKLSAYVNTHADTAFAARTPALLTSKSPDVQVQKVKVQPDASIHYNKDDKADEYFNPEYNITINKAYDDFNYSFSVFIDDKGQMRFGQSTVYLGDDFKESHLRVMKGILDGYLKLYLNVKPGTTLDIPHTSTVILHVTGVKGQ